MKLCFTSAVTLKPRITRENYGLCDYCVDEGSYELFPMRVLTHYATTEFLERGYRVVHQYYICPSHLAPSKPRAGTHRKGVACTGRSGTSPHIEDSAGLTIIPEGETPHGHS